MKRYLTSHRSMAAIAAMTVALFSCNKDEDPVIPVVSFQQAAQTVGEAAGTINVVLQLDVDAPREIKVRYTIGGTATEGTTSSSDYQVLGTYGEVTIPEGASSANLQLQIKQDEAVEADETIIITINDVVSEAATVGATPATTITLQSDDLGAKVGFTATTSTVNESDGTLDIELTLDKAAGQDLTVDYKFNYDAVATVATALDTVYAFGKQIPSRYYDFYVVGGTYGKITIPAGSTTVKVQLKIFSDFILEGDEKIEMNLTAVSAGGQLGTNTKHTVTVKQEDGRLIGLLWDPSYPDVDMDMFLWVGEDATSTTDLLFVAADADTVSKEEDIFIPKVLTDEVADATFGLSFIYYSGTKTPMNFKVYHVDIVNGAGETSPESKAATYTLANINVWDKATGKQPQIEQTFDLVGGVYSPVSDITVPTSSSRQASHALPSNLSRNKVFRNFAPAATRLLRK